VELQPASDDHAGRRAFGDLRIVGEEDVQGRVLPSATSERARDRATRGACRVGASNRGPGTGVNGTAATSFG
jgi:hypothetical protein